MQPEAERYEALLGAMTRLVRAPEAPGALAGDAEGWLAAGGLGADDAAQLAAFGAHRLQIYRRHVRRTLAHAVRQEIPRTAARLGEASHDGAASGPKPQPPAEAFNDGAAGGPKPRAPAEAFNDGAAGGPKRRAPSEPSNDGAAGGPKRRAPSDPFGAWVDRWVDEEGPRSPYFRDLAFELVAWAAPRWAEDASVPSYLGDLARHELVEFDVACALEEAPAPPGDIGLDRGVRFSASARLCRYDHAVHRLDAALDARDVPERTATALLAYRDEGNAVRFLELTPLAAAILERLLRGEPLGQAVVGACAGAGPAGEPSGAVDPAVTVSTATLLGDLLERGAILGGEA